MLKKRSECMALLFIALASGCISAPPQRPPIATPPAGEGLRPTPSTPSAARLLPHSWSPTGEIQVDFLYPPGHLFFYDRTTGRVCPSPVPVTYPYFASTLAWMPDGTALLLSAENQLVEFTPCRDRSPEAVRDLPEPIWSIQRASHHRLLLRTAAGTLTGVEVSTPETTLILSGERSDYLYDRETHALRRQDGRLVAGSFSPDGTYLAVSDDTGTRVIHLTTGKVKAEATWQSQPAEGAPGPDLWLSNREVLITAPVIGGPLILMPGKGVVRGAPEYLGMDCSNRVCRALGARSADTYHLLVQAPGREGHDVWYLYHAESGQAENLGPLTDPRFSPNGEWLAALQDLNGREASAAWVRSTDPPGREPLVFAPVRPHGFLAWSPDSGRLALHLDDGVAVLELAHEWRWAGRWRTAGFEPITARWSPDARHLAIQGVSPQAGGDNALLVVAVP